MSTARKSKPDSFGLLIDTMCNAIGGLVLIAIVVAILGASANPPERVITDLRERVAIEERRLHLLNEEIAILEQQRLLTEGPAVGENIIDEEELNKLYNELRQRRISLQNAQTELESTARQINEIRSTDPATLVSAQIEHTRSLNLESDELERKIVQLELEFAERRELKTLVINLPSERHHRRNDFIVVYNNRIYPFTENEIMRPPENLFRVLERTSESIRFRPIPGRGYSADSPEIDQFLSSISRSGGACIFWFYPDSYGLFESLYNKVKGHNMNHGVLFTDTSFHIGFSSRGREIRSF